MPQEKIKTRNTGRYLCNEENYPHKSFRKNLVGMPISFIKHRSGEINPKYLIIRKNTNPIFTTDILQHKISKINQENFHDLRIPLINSFPIRQRSELNNISHFNNIPLLYKIPSNGVNYMTGNERGNINADIPLISFNGDSSFLTRSNPQDLHQRNFWQNSWQHPYITSNKKNRMMDSPKPIILTNYIDTTTNTIADNEFKLDSTMGIVGKNQEEESNNINASPDLKINYFRSDEKNSTKYTHTIVNPENNTLLNDTVETIQAGRTEIPPELTTIIPINYIDTIIDREVENNPALLSSMGTAESNSADGLSKVITTLAVRNKNAKINSHYPETTDIIENLSRSSTNVFKITTSSLKDYIDSTTNPNTETDLNSNKNLELKNIISTNTESYQYAGSIEQIHDATNGDYNVQQPVDSKTFSIIKSTHTLTKEIEGRKNDEAIQDDGNNKLLGKSKSYTDKFLVDPNINKDGETNIEESTTNKNSQNSQLLLNLESNKEFNDFITTDVNIDSWKSLLDREETTNNSPDSKSAYDFDENNTHSIETTTNSWERTLQEQSTIVQYSNDKKSNYLKISNTDIDSVGTRINKLPFCDNTLLLNSIKKVINSFALDANSINTKNISKNIFQAERAYREKSCKFEI